MIVCIFTISEFLADELDIDPIEIDEDDEEAAFYLTSNVGYCCCCCGVDLFLTMFAICVFVV
jgi:hypothetical protein